MTAKTIAQRAKEASRIIALAPTGQKSAVIQGMAERLAAKQSEIVAASLADVAEAATKRTPDHFVDRSGFREAKIGMRLRTLARVATLMMQKGAGDDCLAGEHTEQHVRDGFLTWRLAPREKRGELNEQSDALSKAGGLAASNSASVNSLPETFPEIVRFGWVE